jgi:hypothetical protein
MLKCFIQPQNQINRWVISIFLINDLNIFKVIFFIRIPPAMAVDGGDFNEGNNFGLCKSKPSAICFEPKFWDFATFDFCREVYHCWPLTEGKCPIHFQKV